ncbi:HK97 family phage prohead protease [Roseibium sp.]|uniref:HK97 family phage prohead protease n=1 Tax=Roseibium sp. TaxID=1936156 RepID=UPI003A97B8BA
MTGVAITGYASLFGQRDGAGDIVRPGAFRATLARRRARGIAMLWQHDPFRPIGMWTGMAEDHRGLRVTGRLLQSVAQGREAAALIAAGALTGLSIGFKARKARRGRDGRSRILFDIDLWEVSLVTFPQVEGARVRLLTNSSTVS